MIPVEIGGDVVGRDREGKHSSERVARHHDVDIGAVDHVHFGLQFTIGERHFLAADVRNLFLQVIRAGPVERQVGERRLRTPATRHVQVIDQLLNALPDLFVGHVVDAHIRRHVGIKRAERLRACPFVLQGAEKIDDLSDRSRHMLRRLGLDLTGDAVESFGQQLAQRPPGAVPREHVQIVDMDVARAVRLTGCRAEYMR